jgi:mannose-6-phosphate isomerase-like protein (cupin superfamily)
MNDANRESNIAGRSAGVAADGGAKQFANIFRSGDLVVEIYAPRTTDLQKPHSRDEIYIVAQGKGYFLCGESRPPFAPGDFLFAGAGVVHRFEDFSDDLAVWVIFFGPEGGGAA